MHETHIIKNIFRYFAQEETRVSQEIKKVCFSLSEFGSITPEHFLEHYRDESRGTKWESIELEVKKIPYGPELAITKIEFK